MTKGVKCRDRGETAFLERHIGCDGRIATGYGVHWLIQIRICLVHIVPRLPPRSLEFRGAQDPHERRLHARHTVTGGERLRKLAGEGIWVQSGGEA